VGAWCLASGWQVDQGKAWLDCIPALSE